MVLVMRHLILCIFHVFTCCILINCSVNHDVMSVLQKLHISTVDFNSSRIFMNFNKSASKSGTQFLNSQSPHSQKKCLEDLMYIIQNIKSEWAMKMIDSYGKVPSGLLLGDLLWTGKYDECLAVNVSRSENATSGFNGMYCMSQWNISLPNTIHLPMHEVPIKIGVCLPDSCNSLDIKKDVSLFIELLYHLPMIKNYEGELKLTALTCSSKDIDLNFATVLFLCFLGLYFLLCVAGSILTITRHFWGYSNRAIQSMKSLKNDASDTESLVHIEKEECEDDQMDILENNNNLIKTETQLNNLNMKRILKKFGELLKCFCIFTNAAQVLNTKSSKKQFPCLHGLRFFSLTWVILGHTYVHNVNYFDNYLDLLKGIDNLPFQAIMQGTFSVDTFFLIGGFLLGYLYLEEADKRNGRINWLGLCLHRFLRITPVYLFLIGFSSLTFKYLGSGPFWEEADDVATCKQYWWWNVLYINNFLPINLMCLTWTWYLANDMQFFVMSSIILYLLWRSRYVGVGIFSMILLCSWAVTWYLSSMYNIIPLFMGITEVKNYTEYQGRLILAWDLLYSKPYCRIGPHIVGIFLACFLYYDVNRKILTNKGVQFLGWCVAIVCSASVIFGLYHAHPSSTLINAYNAFGRTAFSVGVAWLIFCCLTGHAGFLNDFLSYKLWIPLSRLTYCAYLFHPIIMNWYFQSRATPVFFTHSTMIILYFSFLFTSYGVAFIISITFETPIINLEKLLYKR